MKRLIIHVTNPVGLYASPAGELVQFVKQFPCSVQLRYQDREVNLKSMMGVLSLGIPSKAQIEILVNGLQEKQTMDLIEDKIQSLRI